MDVYAWFEWAGGQRCSFNDTSGSVGSATIQRCALRCQGFSKLTFSGTRVKLFVTVKANGNRVSCDINFDGAVTNAYRDPHYIDYYRDMWFDTHPITDGEHTITVTNRGTEGGHPFQFDYFEIDGTPIGAAPAPPTTPRTTTTPAPSPRPSSSSRFITQTQVQTQVSTQTRVETVVLQTSVSTIVDNNTTRLTTITSSSTSTAPASHATQQGMSHFQGAYTLEYFRGRLNTSNSTNGNQCQHSSQWPSNHRYHRQVSDCCAGFIRWLQSWFSAVKVRRRPNRSYSRDDVRGTRCFGPSFHSLQIISEEETPRPGLSFPT